MDIALITGCMGVGVRYLMDLGLQEILVSVNAMVQPCTYFLHENKYTVYLYGLSRRAVLTATSLTSLSG